MKRFRDGSHAASWILVLASAAAAGGCASSAPSARPASPSARPATPSKSACRGTLGFEAGPITRQVRRKLGLPNDFRGALVAEVLPGGPASAAGVLPGDIVEKVGTSRTGNDCELIDAAYGRSCEPVRVTLRRASASVEVTIVPVDETAFFERSCRDGLATGCFRKGWLLWRDDKQDVRERGVEILLGACQAGSADACAYAGQFLFARPDRAKEAVGILERACERKSGGGCATLAYLYATGSGTLPKDDRRATPLYGKACDLGDAQGCYNAGLMAADGRGAARDLVRAAAKYDEACELGGANACTNLGFAYENGRGVAKDPVRAVALYQRGCAGSSCQRSNLTGCVNLARAYRDGKGAAKDERKAASIFQEACDRKPDPDDVGNAENRARACSLLGGLYLAGDGIEKDLAKARDLSERGCEQADTFGCFNSAVIYSSGSGVEKDAAKADTFLARACDGGDAESCHDLAVAYEKGSGVERDTRRSAELMRKSCELGFAAACPKKGR